jgi:hypothetical protein
MNLRIMVAILVGLFSAPVSRMDFAESSGVVLAQSSATSPSAQASPATPPGMVPLIEHSHAGFLWVKGHPLLMPYRGCADLIQRTMWGQQVSITDAPCKAKLEEALRIDRTEPDVESAPPLLNGSRPEDLSPPGTQPDSAKAKIEARP